MSEAIRSRLVNAEQAHKAINAAYQSVKPMLMDGKVFELSIKPETRSLKENALLHSLISHIAKTQEWAGKKRDIDTWRRLLISAWCRANGEQVELLQALDGYGVDIVFRRSSKLSRKECADLIEYIFAWGTDVGVRFPADPLHSDESEAGA